jgi:hypothetical protein
MARRQRRPPDLGTRELRVELDAEVHTRLEYLRQLVGAVSDGEVVLRAVRAFDKAVCAVKVEGAECRLLHRNGRTEPLEL